MSSSRRKSSMTFILRSFSMWQKCLSTKRSIFSTLRVQNASTSTEKRSGTLVTSSLGLITGLSLLFISSLTHSFSISFSIWQFLRPVASSSLSIMLFALSILQLDIKRCQMCSNLWLWMEISWSGHSFWLWSASSFTLLLPFSSSKPCFTNTESMHTTLGFLERADAKTW